MLDLSPCVSVSPASKISEFFADTHFVVWVCAFKFAFARVPGPESIYLASLEWLAG